MIIPVILAGGSGTRLWPMSRELFPKQLLKLAGDHTMLQQTVLRVRALENAAGPMLICNIRHRYPVAEQLRELGLQDADMILEPVGKNTAPAVAVAAIRALSQDREARILVLPADHRIGDEAVFRSAVSTAERYAARGYLVTFGIIPDSPETGYGYICKGRPLDGGQEAGAWEIERFVEKPDRPTAEKYISSGRYCWNSGMFLFRAADVCRELERVAPRILAACQEALDRGGYEGEAFCLDKAAFGQCPSDSIDYAVMEKTKKGAMVPFQAGWSDLGSWAAMWETGEKDADGNVIDGEVMARDLKNSLVFSGSRLVAALGLEDSVVVDTPDALLVAHRSRAQDVKNIASALKEQKRSEALRHRRAFCPWGTVAEIHADAECTVRRAEVRGGKGFSLAGPAGRTLYWTVVSGSGRIECGGAPQPAERGFSLEIAPGRGIRVENPGGEPLVFLEVSIPGGGPEHLVPADMETGGEA